MPTIRYQIKNEYVLGSSELYRAADKADPEAILEGVAVAGLIGLLRQLGDLAEFAADIFHNLHEEVVKAASRGHKLTLRVQHIETHLPSTENVFFPEKIPCLSYQEGIDWHRDLLMSNDLISPGNMPHFIMDTYEECRGPPQFSKLDKFDVAGAGACLKRYSDPSFYRLQSASGLLKQDVRREKRTCKTKKVSYSCNDEPPEYFLVPHIDSRSLQHIKLKPRQLNESVIQSSRRNKGNHTDLHLTEKQVISETSLRQTMIKSAESSELVCEVHEIVVDPSSTPTEPEKRTANELENEKPQSKGLSDSHIELASEVEVHPYTLEEKPTITKNSNNTEGHSYSSHPSEANSCCSAVQKVDQSGFSTDAESTSENSSDGYISDEVSSELDSNSYMDALTNMESEIETDAEIRTKRDSAFVSIEPQETDSDISEEQDELKDKYSEQYLLENSTSSPGFCTIFRKGAAHPSFSDTLGHLAAQLLEENMKESTIPSNSEVSLVKTDVKTSNIPTSALGEEVYSSATDSTSTMLLVSSGLHETSSSSDEITDKAASYLDSELTSKEKSNKVHQESAKTSSILSDSLCQSTEKMLLEDDFSDEIDFGTYIEQSTHGSMSTTNRNDLHSQKQHGTAPEGVSTGIELGPATASNMKVMQLKKLEKQDKVVRFNMKTVIVDGELRNAIASDDDLASSTSVPIPTQHIVDQMVLPHNSTATCDTLEDVEVVESCKDQAMSSPPSFPAKLSDVESSSGFKTLQECFENSKGTVPDVTTNMIVRTSEETFKEESSNVTDSASFLQDVQQLEPSANQFVEDSFSKQSTGIYSNELVDKKIIVESSESSSLSYLKASNLFTSTGSDEHVMLTESSGVSDLEVEGHPNSIILHNRKDPEPFGRISSAEKELLDDTSGSQAAVPYIVCEADHSESDMLPLMETISNKHSGEGSVPFQSDSGLHEDEELISCSSFRKNNTMSEDIKEIQISQPQPIPWTLTKPPLGSLVSSKSVAQPRGGSNVAIWLSAAENVPSEILLTEVVELSHSNCNIQSQKSTDIAEIVEESCEHDSLHPNSNNMDQALEILLEEDKQVYEGKPTEPPPKGENKSSQEISVSSNDEAHSSTLSEVIPNADSSEDLELPVSEDGAANLDRKSPIPFLMASAMEDEKHKYNHTMLPPLPMTKPSGNESLPMEDKSSSSLHDLTPQSPENEKQPKKLHSVINRPDAPLIEAIASHDKSKLKKAPELVRSSAMPNCDEKGSFLEQIKNKSFSLRPTVAPTMKFKGGPPTNIKVIAILEKANAIRQACVGSDDEDDRDSWSDS